MSDGALRGTRLGATSYENDDHVELAPRQVVHYDCPNGHTTSMPFSMEADVPALGVVRLGLAALCATRPGETRLVGARELALGLGTLSAHRTGAPTSGWVAAMAVSDGGDALAFIAEAARPTADGMAGGSRSRALWLAAFGASGLVAEGLTAYALRRAGE